MPAPDLAAAIDAGDTEAVLAALAPLDEGARDAIAREIAERHATIERAAIAAWGSSDSNAGERAAARHRAAALALFGTGSLAQVRTCRIAWPLAVGDVLLARRPPWARAWCEAHVTTHWGLVRTLERAGVVTLPASEARTMGLIGSARAGKRGAHALLEADPALLERDIWDLFAYEGHGENSLAAADKYAAPERQWGTLLVTLAGEGRLPRARLLDASLDALERDYAPFRAGWFSRFHEALAPTLGERTVRAERYSRLLASNVPATVAFAKDALLALERGGVALPARTLADLAPAYRAKAKGTARDAVALAGRILARHPHPERDVAAVTAALEHAAPEVQRAALDLIARFGDRNDPALRATLVAAQASVAASVRADVRALLPDACAARAEPARARITEEPRVRAFVRARVTPVESLDDLVSVCAAALETECTPDDLERALDGISRLCAERPRDFERLTSPLRKRSTSLCDPERPAKATFAQRAMAGAVRSWLAGTPPLEERARRLSSSAAFLARRVADVAGRAASGRAAHLLAAPTHAGGPIAPVEFVERARANGEHADRFDLIGAMLRLAREDRAPALAAAAGLGGERGAAIRYALGGDVPDIGDDAALWIAASRVRDPEAHDPRVAERHPAFAGPGATCPGTLTLVPDRTRGSAAPDVTIEPRASDASTLDMPTALVYARLVASPWEWETPPLEQVRWHGTIAPAARDGWFAAGVVRIWDNLDWHTARWSDRAYFEPLLDGDVALTDTARRLVAAGLLAKDAAQGTLAADAMANAVTDGRLGDDGVAAILADVAAWSPHTTTRRAIPRLARVADASPEATHRVAAGLQRVLADATATPAAGRLLHALLEELRHAEAASDPALQRGLRNASISAEI